MGIKYIKINKIDVPKAALWHYFGDVSLLLYILRSKCITARFKGIASLFWVSMQIKIARKLHIAFFAYTLIHIHLNPLCAAKITFGMKNTIHHCTVHFYLWHCSPPPSYLAENRANYLYFL